MPNLIEYSHFRECVVQNKSIPIQNPSIRKDFAVKITLPEDDESNIATFTASTAIVDSMGDTINQSGWKLDRFLMNPVILWGHDSSRLPIGRAVKTYFDDVGNLTLDVEFVPREVQAFAGIVRDHVKLGFIKAGSVGFQPLKWAWVENGERFGIDFDEQELLEFSLVTIPANPEALVHPQKSDPAPAIAEPDARRWPRKAKAKLQYLKLK